MEILRYPVARANPVSAAAAPAIRKPDAAWSVVVTRKAGNATNVNQLITEIPWNRAVCVSIVDYFWFVISSTPARDIVDIEPILEHFDLSKSAIFHANYTIRVYI